MKKENVYVEVRTEKQAKKLKKVLEMFGERLYSKYSISTALDNNWVINYNKVDLEWENSSQRNKTEVTIKQLRNILALEHLKEGGVIVCKTELGKCILKINSLKDNLIYYDEDCKYINGSDYIGSGYCLKRFFIRYATEEEKALLKTAELTADDYKDLTWYKSTQTGNIFFLDKSKRENYGFSKYGYRDELEWFSNFQANEFNTKGEWIEASEEEVFNKLYEEVEKRYKIGDTIKNHQGEFTLENLRCKSSDSGIYNTQGLGLWLFYQGKWAEVIKKEKTVEEKVIEYAKSVDWDFMKVYRFIDRADGVSGLSFNDSSLLEGRSVLGKIIRFFNRHNKQKC